MRTRPTIWLTAVFLVVFFGGCQSNPSTTSPESDDAEATEVKTMSADSMVSDSSEAPPRTFSGHGVIKNITPSRTYVVIQHGPIAGFMGAMTMPFELRNQKLLEGVAIGDSIAFTLTSTGRNTWLSEMARAE